MQRPLMTVQVAGGSMLPTLRPGDCLLVRRGARVRPGASDDSRRLGPADVVGRVLLRYWPAPGRVGRAHS